MRDQFEIFFLHKLQIQYNHKGGFLMENKSNPLSRAKRKASQDNERILRFSIRKYSFVLHRLQSLH